ncbi:MAG: biopolymer transporter ExbD [Prevotellaceae bacterium]|jgi:biopolymer transport protein ExbD|nr:biopolymer transporter ExbD [Prevotellaceae bacterium]
MAKRKKGMPELNGAGMSDISFLLLCFFLMTSSMDESMGINRILPQIPDENLPPPENKVKPHNVLSVLVDGQDRLSVNSRIVDIKDLKAVAKEFIANPANDPTKSSKKEVTEDIPNIPGIVKPVMATEAVISLQNARSTSFDVYLRVQNELTAAYSELRDEASKERFGRKFSELNEVQRDFIGKKIYAQRISESPPKDTRKRRN